MLILLAALIGYAYLSAICWLQWGRLSVWVQRTSQANRLLRCVLWEALWWGIPTDTATTDAHALRLRLPAAMRRRVRTSGHAHPAADHHTGSVGGDHVVNDDDDDVTSGEQRAVSGSCHVGPTTCCVTWSHDTAVCAHFRLASARSVDDVILAVRSHRLFI